MTTLIRKLIFDWDGTLCDSIEAAFAATCAIFRLCGLQPPTFEEYIMHQRPPFIQFYRDRGVLESVSDEQIWTWYKSHAKHHENCLFEDVIPSITRMRDEGCKIALVTSQEKTTVRHLFDVHKCGGLFDHVLCDAMPNKRPFFVQACKLLDAEPDQVYAIGDIAYDMTEANDAGLIPIGIVRNGHQVAEILYQAGAARVIRSLHHLLI